MSIQAQNDLIFQQPIIPLVYTCKDCFFFKDGVCNDPNEIRFTSEENPSCISFEYKTIVEQK